MSGQDKTVKITIVVDPAAAALAKRSIAEITTAVGKLVEATKAAGGLFGGGGVGVGNIAGRPGTSSSTQVSQNITGTKAAGGALTGGVANIAAVFAGASNSAKSSFRTMQDGLRGLADSGEREVARLQRTFGKLAPLYAAANAESSRARGNILSAAGNAETDRLRGKPPTPPPGGGGGGFTQGIQNLGRALGLPPWALGAAGGIGAVIGAGSLLYSSYGGQVAAQNQYNLAAPLYNSHAAGAVGGIFGGNALAIRGGDVARAYALQQVSATAEYKKVISESYKQDIKDKIRLAAPVGFSEAVKTGRVGAVWDQFTSQLGAGASNIMRHPLAAAKQVGMIGLGIPGNVMPQDLETAVEQKRNEENQKNVAAQPQARQALIENYMRAHPLLSSQLNEFYGGAIGGLGASRMAGISGKFYKRKDGTYADTLADYEAAANRMGTTGAEISGFRQQMGATAGRGFFSRGAALLSPQAGGLSNVAQLYGVGGQFGAGGGWRGASSFVNAFQGQIGKGGLDVTAGAQVGGSIMSGMTGGNFGGGTGLGFQSGMLEMASAGTTGGDMRGARVAAAGMGAMQNLMNGGSSPLDSALNWSASLRINNIPWSARARLAKMDTATMMEIMRNGDKNLDPTLRALGINAGNVRQFMQLRGTSMFAGVINDSRFLSPEARGAFQAYQRSGGNTHYMRGMTKSDRRNAEAGLSAVAMARDPSLSLEAAQGQVRAMEAAWGDLPALRGRGAHRSDSMKSNRGQGAKTTGHFVAKTGKDLAEAEHKGKLVSGAIGSMSPGEEGEEKAGKAAVDATGGGLNATIDQLATIMRRFVSQLHGEVGAEAGPPGG